MNAPELQSNFAVENVRYRISTTLHYFEELYRDHDEYMFTFIVRHLASSVE